VRCQAAPRCKPERVKESIARFNGYENSVFIGKNITEREYQTPKYSWPYRHIVVRKNTGVRKGESPVR